MSGVVNFKQLVELAKQQHVAYLKHSVLGPVLADRDPGGWLCATDLRGRHPRRAEIVQFSDPQRRNDCYNFSFEKPSRLAQHPDHLLSRQSEDPDNNQFAGAARGSSCLLGYSGDPSQIDELKALALLVKAGDITRDRMIEILTLFPNKYVQMMGQKAEVHILDF